MEGSVALLEISFRFPPSSRADRSSRRTFSGLVWCLYHLCRTPNFLLSSVGRSPSLMTAAPSQMHASPLSPSLCPLSLCFPLPNWYFHLCLPQFSPVRACGRGHSPTSNQVLSQAGPSSSLWPFPVIITADRPTRAESRVVHECSAREGGKLLPWQKTTTPRCLPGKDRRDRTSAFDPSQKFRASVLSLLEKTSRLPLLAIFFGASVCPSFGCAPYGAQTKRNRG